MEWGEIGFAKAELDIKISVKININEFLIFSFNITIIPNICYNMIILYKYKPDT